MTNWKTEPRKGISRNGEIGHVYKNFCTCCAEAVVDGAGKTVRVTKGVYLPIEHQCNSVRVYDLRGNLLEVKPL
jgi:hypothetical protein